MPALRKSTRPIVDEPVSNATGNGVTLLVITMIFFLFPFMSASLNVALPSIGIQLSLDAVTLGWITTADTLAGAALLVPFGRIGDIYGRKKIFISGIAIFALASLFAGMATSGGMLISFRVLQGVGVAMFVATGVALLTSIFPADERGKVLGINVAGIYSGLTVGPLLGGVLTQHLGWRSIFFLTFSLGLVITGVLLWRLKGEWTGAKGEKFDFAGSVIYSFALAALAYGFVSLPATLGVCSIVVGVIGLLAFARWEMRIRSPVLDINLFRNSRAFTFSSLATLLGNTAFLVVPFLISLYLQYVKGFDPESAGLTLVALYAMTAIFSPLAGRLSDRIEPRIVASTGLALLTVGLVMLVFLSENPPLGLVIANLVLIGFGQAFFSSPNTNVIMSSAPSAAYGVASATIATMRQIGVVLGMGVTMMMLSLYIGRVQITPEYYTLFQESMKTSFIILAILCFAGIFVSLVREKVR
jgi:EmrB/QacA subfamily drug resistance transporter